MLVIDTGLRTGGTCVVVMGVAAMGMAGSMVLSILVVTTHHVGHSGRMLVIDTGLRTSGA